jgi:hypothetical protein
MFANLMEQCPFFLGSTVEQYPKQGHFLVERQRDTSILLLSSALVHNLDQL